MKIQTLILLLFFFSTSLMQFIKAQNVAQLLSGPLVGNTTSSKANIWVETDMPADVKVHYWFESGEQPIVKGVAAGRTDSNVPHTGTITLEELPPRALVHYELEIDGRTIRPQTVQSFLMMPAPQEPVDFKVAFASCINPIRVPLQPLWTQLGIVRPDALLLIGDNNYMPMRPEAYDAPDSTISYALARYHRYLRDVPGLRSILSSTPTCAIWDDHDYGPNNSERTFRWRELSLDLFKKYWPNPAAGTSSTEGIFFSFKIADVEFFMLDDRYHRDPNDATDRKTMLGTGQLEWLKKQLISSTAQFKVIVNGHTTTINRGDRGKYWANFGNERDEFLKWMFSQNIEGVFFISGDWHVGSLSRIEFSEESYPLYELISSNAGVHLIENDDHQYSYNRQSTEHNRRFDGPVINDIRDYNFGLLEFSGTGKKRTVTLKIIDHYGEVRVAHNLTKNDLRIQP